jgi:HEAT repeat protein
MLIFHTSPSTRSQVLTISEPLISTCSPDAVQHLAPFLHHKNEGVRITTIKAMNNIESEDATTALLPLLKSSNPKVLVQVIRKFASVKMTDRIELVTQFLSHSDGRVRAMALHVMTAMSAYNQVREIAPLLHDLDPLVRVAAISALGELCTPNLVNLISPLLKDPDTDVRLAALQYLEGEGAAALPVILPFLNDTEDNLRRAAVNMVGHVGSPPHIKSLTPLLGHDDWYTQIRAAHAIAYIGRCWDVPIPWEIVSESMRKSMDSFKSTVECLALQCLAASQNDKTPMR